MLALTNDRLSICNIEPGGELSLNLSEISGPSLETAIKASLETVEQYADNSKTKNTPDTCQETDASEKAAWTISAAAIGAGLEKIISLGYISPEVAIIAGTSIGTLLLAKKIYEQFRKKENKN